VLASGLKSAHDDVVIAPPVPHRVFHVTAEIFEVILFEGGAQPQLIHPIRGVEITLRGGDSLRVFNS
jgi:hypothetical protein